MNRRHFLTAAAAGAALSPLVTTTARAADAAPPARQYFEWRRYRLRRGPKQKVWEDYLREAWIPAMRRAGAGPIGVFHVMLGPESPSLHLLIPYPSLETFATAAAKMKEDTEYQRLSSDVRNHPASDPVYQGAENSLHAGIAGMPTLEVPPQVAAGRSRIYELRVYQSHNKAANVKKIQMFNDGELALFRRTGLTPVFFGETLVGQRQPNLTYLLVFDDLAARDKAWSTFANDPEWKTMSSTPGFTDPEIVTDISNLLLRPAAYSQV